MKRSYVNITAYVMAVVMILTSILSLPFSVSAQTTATDDNGNNIIKVLDMALNKSGISASPTTIQDFLDYMHDTVTAGAQAWSDLADSAFDSVSDYVSACKDKVADTASNIPDSAKSLINGYLDYMGQCFDVVENAKTGYAQGENFRNYIMSFVTDETDKQINGAISKNSKYNIKGGLVNLVRQNMDAYIEEHEGYYLVPTLTYKDISPTQFGSKAYYDQAYDFLKNTLGDELVFLRYYGNSFVTVALLDDLYFVNTSYSNVESMIFEVKTYNDNWIAVQPFIWDFPDAISVFPNTDGCVRYSSSTKRFGFYVDGNINHNLFYIPFSNDGRIFKIWKSLDSFKLYSVGRSNIYYSSAYSTFDNSVDNSVTFSGGYYMTNDYSHTTIQNNIDNSQEINETTINNIVNNYITNNYYGSDDGSGGGSGGGGGSGNWFTDLITGIPQLLSALLDGIAALLEAGGNLLGVITDLFTKLFVPSEGFADPIKTKIEDKFVFIGDAHSSMLDIVDRFDTMGQTAPTITFPLSETPLAKYGVGDITVTFDWFEPYRVGFHLLISAIMWAMFLFNQFFGLKHLIQGTGSFTSTIDAEEPDHNPIGFLW